MAQNDNSFLRKLSGKPFFRNRFYSAALAALRERPGDVSYFLGQLVPEMQKSRDQVLPLLERVKNATLPGEKKFAPDAADRHLWLQKMNVQTVIDVGAWQGDSVRLFHDLFPAARIYSFEPLKDCYEKLQALEKEVSGLKTFNYAIGEAPGRVQMNRSEFSPSSSLLKMKETHKEAFPFTANEIQEEIEVRTLDSFIPEIDFGSPSLLKIDVQGFEEHVIKGATELLQKVDLIIVELSFVELYAGQPLFDTIYQLLYSRGFAYSGSFHQLLRPQDGLVLQQNGIFVKRK